MDGLKSQPLFENSRSMIFMNYVLVDDVYQYLCTECNTSFRQKSNCTAHIRTVHLNKTKMCKYCMKSYKKLSQHMADVHGRERLTCEFCQQKFDSLRCLKRHERTQHCNDVSKVENRMAICKVCKLSVRKGKLTNHMELKHLLPADFAVPCPICKVRVKFLPFHIHKFHKEYNIKRDLYCCKRCRRYFLNWKDLQAHEKDHVVYTCSVCDAVFDKVMKLGWHLFESHLKVFNLGRRTRTRQRSGPTEDPSKACLWDFQRDEEVKSNRELVKNEEYPEEIETDSDEKSEEIVTEADFNREEIETDECDILEIELGLDGKIINTMTGQEIGQFEETSIMDSCPVELILMEDTLAPIQSGHREKSFEETDCAEEPGPGEMYIESQPEENNPPLNEINLEMCKLELPGFDVRSSTSVLYSPFQTLECEPSEPTCLYVQSLKDDAYIAVEEVELDDGKVSSEDQNIVYQGLEDSLTQDLANDDKLLVENLKHNLIERKISQIFTSKENLPRDLKDVKLPPDDFKILNTLAADEGIEYKDLSRLQISAPPKNKDDRDQSNRHKYVDSRQAHVCPYCQTILKSRFILQRHISVKHFNLRPFPCTYCHKKFPSNADLKKHTEASHVPQTLVECDICRKEYRSGYLKRHKQFAHKSVFPAACDLCASVFKNREVMLQHRRKKHK